MKALICWIHKPVEKGRHRICVCYLYLWISQVLIMIDSLSVKTHAAPLGFFAFYGRNTFTLSDEKVNKSLFTFILYIEQWNE